MIKARTTMDKNRHIRIYLTKSGVMKTPEISFEVAMNTSIGMKKTATRVTVKLRTVMTVAR